MVLRYYHQPADDITLEDIAAKVLGNPAADKAAWPQKMYKAFEYTCRIAERALYSQELRAWIANAQPVQPYFQWSDGGNHTVLVVGSYGNGDFEVYDPVYGKGPQSYEFLLSARKQGSWQGTWYDMRPPVVPVA
jgi:hypothetical protein